MLEGNADGDGALDQMDSKAKDNSESHVLRTQELSPYPKPSSYIEAISITDFGTVAPADLKITPANMLMSKQMSHFDPVRHETASFDDD